MKIFKVSRDFCKKQENHLKLRETGDFPSSTHKFPLLELSLQANKESDTPRFLKTI